MTRLIRVFAACLLVAPAPLLAQDALWHFAAAHDIEFFQLTPLGHLVIATRGEMLALDPETGDTLWTRADLSRWKEAGFAVLPESPFGVLRTNDEITVIDVGSGTTLWDHTAQPLEKVRGYFDVPELNALLLYGETPESDKTLAAVHIETGELLWRQDDLFDKKPEIEKVDGISTAGDNQPPLMDTDTTLVLYISKDGPIKLDVRTGQRLWWADEELKGKDLPLLSRWYPPMLHDEGVLYIPYEKKMVALDASDGSIIWERDEDFESPIAQMQMFAPLGLVVRGARPLDQEYRFSMPDAFLDVVDRETGMSKWPEPFTDMKDESVAPFLVHEDRVYIGDKEQLSVLRPEDGSILDVNTYEFGDGEEPTFIEWRDDRIILSSEHNILSIDSTGRSRFRHLPAPGRSFMSKVGSIALFALSVVSQAAAQERTANSSGPTLNVWFEYEPFFLARREALPDAQNHVFMYTEEPDASGREGFSLVRLGRTDGEESGRLWLDERNAEYVLDEIGGFVFFKSDDSEIVAYRAPGPAADGGINGR